MSHLLTFYKNHWFTIFISKKQKKIYKDIYDPYAIHLPQDMQIFLSQTKICKW